MKRTLLFQYIIFIVVLVCCIAYFKFLYTKTSTKETTSVNSIENKTDSIIIAVKYSPLDSLLNEKQKLQELYFMEVTGQSSGKQGIGPRAKALQKQIEDIEKTIEVLQLYTTQRESITGSVNKNNNQK